MVSPMQAYFLPNHGNGEASVLGKLSYMGFGSGRQAWFRRPRATFVHIWHLHGNQAIDSRFKGACCHC
jgi:hypothetical protein